MLELEQSSLLVLCLARWRWWFVELEMGVGLVAASNTGKNLQLCIQWPPFKLFLNNMMQAGAWLLGVKSVVTFVGRLSVFLFVYVHLRRMAW